MDSDRMTTNRTPIQRPALTMISPRALELFAELELARRARRRAVDCAVSEYGLIEETFAPAALQVLGDWIAQRVQR